MENVHQWFYSQTCLCREFNFVPKSKVLGLDLDGTLIAAKILRKNASESSFEFTYEVQYLREKLLEWIENGFCLAIITNQAGISSKVVDESSWRIKLDNMIEQLNLPILVVSATKKDYYRKPFPGIYEMLKEQYIGGEIEEFVFVGDAAGRKIDHSDFDLKFALNTGATFFTPESFFSGVANDYPIMQKLVIEEDFTSLKLPEADSYVLIGPRFCGKTLFSSVFIGEDKNVEEGEFSSVKERRKIIRKLKKEGTVVAVVFDYSLEILRVLGYISSFKGLCEACPETEIKKWKKNFENIGKEGFSKVVHLDFKFMDDPSQRKWFELYF